MGDHVMSESAVIHEQGLFGQINIVKKQASTRSQRLGRTGSVGERQRKPRNRKANQAMDRRSPVLAVGYGLTADQQQLVAKAFWIVGYQMAMARKRGVNVSDECESDAQFALIQSVKRYKPELGTFESWAAGWVIGAISRGSKRGRRFKGEAGTEVLQARSNDTEEQERQEYARELIHAAVHQLAPRHQRIAKAILAGKSQKAIAAEWSITEWTARVWVGQVHDWLKQILTGTKAADVNDQATLFPDV